MCERVFFAPQSIGIEITAGMKTNARAPRRTYSLLGFYSINKVSCFFLRATACEKFPSGIDRPGSLARVSTSRHRRFVIMQIGFSRRYPAYIFSLLNRNMVSQPVTGKSACLKTVMLFSAALIEMRIDALATIRPI